MSKELEALEQIKASHFQAHIESENIGDFDIWFEEYYNLLRKALTPPTQEEVCEALSEYYGRNVYYEKGYFLYRKEECYNQPFIIAYKYKSGLVELTKNVLPPHIIEMIGKFYKGIENEA